MEHMCEQATICLKSAGLHNFLLKHEMIWTERLPVSAGLMNEFKLCGANCNDFDVPYGRGITWK
jgi:hypothetical protein